MKAELLSCYGNDDMVVDCARVSFDKRAKNCTPEQNAKLIGYLAREGHFTPFCHPQIQFRISAPIFIVRQWFRSNVGVARSETSRRYVSNEPEFFIPDGWRAKPKGSIKQGSGHALEYEKQVSCDATVMRARQTAEDAYEKLLDNGAAPEQARMVLPQSMETQWIETGSLAYYARICKQRMDGHAQKEIQQLAGQVAEQIAPLFPVSWPELMR